ncbi:MAG: hypothetical protein P4L72_10995 [Parvibaculum sp.]|uniref:hypothetical protein n=1 Tax=Parvibaculum sp. TaxID=2024848 RepID=UPI0028415DE6|nr:hypothetical protein [Parvibaculum sp.]MDR3499737.1 hypothetical protein [Parvibaculum sp.]
MAMSGGAVIFMRTCPQRHPASQGRFHSLIGFPFIGGAEYLPAFNDNGYPD